MVVVMELLSVVLTVDCWVDAMAALSEGSRVAATVAELVAD